MNTQPPLQLGSMEPPRASSEARPHIFDPVAEALPAVGAGQMKHRFLRAAQTLRVNSPNQSVSRRPAQFRRTSCAIGVGFCLSETP